jgi:hypothetical protein
MDTWRGMSRKSIANNFFSTELKRFQELEIMTRIGLEYWRIFKN